MSQTNILSAKEFYNKLGENYYLFSSDWWADVEEEGKYYDTLFKQFGATSILDCSCGPGTQAIGLAKRGYLVTAADVTEELILEAKKNAIAAGVDIEFTLSDVLSLTDNIKLQFDVVLSAGNALPHLETQKDITHALHEMAELVRPGGRIALGLRNYENILERKPRFDFRRVQEKEGEKTLFFDLWDYPSNERILFHLFILKETMDDWKMFQHLTTPLYPIKPTSLFDILREVGFVDIRQEEHRWGIVFTAQKRQKSAT